MSKFWKCQKRLWLSPMWSWNVFPSSAIWVTHLGQEEGWRKQHGPEWDVLGQSSRSYLLSWQPGVHHYGQGCIIPARGASYRPGVHHTGQGCIIPARGASYRPGVHHTGQGCIIPARGASYRPGVHHTGQGCIIPARGASYRPGVHHTGQGCIIPYKGKDIQGLCPECIDIWDWDLGDEESDEESESAVWRGQNGWWWDGRAECRWRIGNAVWICTVYWVYRALMRWWGGVDWDGLGMWNVRVRMIGCRPVEMWWWQGWDVWILGRGRKTWYEWTWYECVKDDMKAHGLHPELNSVLGYVEGLHFERNV